MNCIIKDTRQQKGKHDRKHKQIIECGARLFTSCIPCGDYCSFDNLSEETKSKVKELSFQYDNGIKPKPKLRKEVSEALLKEITVSVDTKQDLDELSKNLMNRKDHSRFWKEVRKAKANSIHLIILIEHSKNIKDIKDVANWNSFYSNISGRALMDEIYRTHIAYGVDFIFCNKFETGKKIVELLNVKV